MRILAIRGANLASLKGNFEVDLAKPPLCHLGLFAIAGPVGAGKSTLLDAMCLALFNRTPRLSGRGGSPLSRDGDALKSNDPRSLVRRTAAKAFAEVDFVGTDGRLWRARWQVHRAHGQAFGKLQDESLSLVDVESGQRVGEGKEGTLEEIRARLGLTFDEFCRSVLLAQGGFSTFLKARPDERASLLEKITGTDLYSTLSIQAFERARAEAAALRALDDELAALRPASPDERARLDAELADANGARARAEEALARLEHVERHRARRVELERALAAATRSVEELRAARDGSLDAAELTSLEKAWPLRSLARDERAARAWAVSRHGAAAAAQRDLRRAESALAAATEHAMRADELLAAREQAWRDAEPLLERAAILDERIARADVDGAQAAHASSRDALEGAQRELDELRFSRAHTHADLDRAEEVLAREPELVALLGAWPMLEHDLAVLAHDDTELEGARAIADAMVRNRNDAVEALDAAREEAARVARALDEARRALQALFPGVPAHDVAAQLATLEARAARRRGIEDDLARVRAQLDGCRRDAAAARDVEAVAREARERAQAALAAAEKTLFRLERSAERAALVDGEPCPLCGSTDHPAAHDQGPAHDVVHDQRAAVAALRADVDAHGEKRAGAEARAVELERMARGLGVEAERLRAALDDVASVDVDLPAARDAFLRARSLESDSERAKEAVDDAEANARAAAQESAAHMRVVEAKAADREKRAASLRKHLGVLDDLASPRQALERLRPRVEGLRAQQKLAHAARVALQKSEPRLRALEQGVAGEEARVDELARRARELEAERAALVDERQALLRALSDGAPAAEVRARLAGDLDEARAGALDAKNALAGAEARLAEVAARARTCDSEAADAERALDDAVRALQAECACQELAPDEIARVADLDDDALDRRRVALRALDEGIARAEAVRAEREAALREHGVVDESDLLRGTVHEARASVEAATERWSRARAAVLHDDHARARAAELLPRIEAQRAKAATWSALSDVIGSADGARFRVFAQSLTLDALLVHANAHLATLAPRYRLERASAEGEKRPRFDLDLVVVDRESGDDVRSVGSLSGGESFLVSLALALGLSSLSSSRTRVESLFIDEGFSSLDPDTLEAALAALEALRATGRQVGVISHVPALVERLGAQVRVVPLGGGRSRVDVSHAG
jgi:exonuclease SbcC